MPPTPKRPSTRRRRHHYPGAATLAPVDPGEVTVPKLPKHPAGKRWHPETRRAWRLVHESPMFPEYDESDVAALFRYAVLVDAFWTAESESARVKFSAELRMVSQSLGLTPLDRRRLSWEIDKGEEAEARTRKRRNRAAATEVSIGAVDPLAVLIVDDAGG